MRKNLLFSAAMCIARSLSFENIWKHFGHSQVVCMDEQISSYKKLKISDNIFTISLQRYIKKNINLVGRLCTFVRPHISFLKIFNRLAMKTYWLVKEKLHSFVILAYDCAITPISKEVLVNHIMPRLLTKLFQSISTPN
jgi:hypothetical protein